MPLIDDLSLGEGPVAAAVTLGGWLRSERERKGIGLDAVEEATRIRVGQLRAIEEDRLDDLPGEAYARGFVRSYAEQLGSDPATATDLFNRQWRQAHGPAHSHDGSARYPRVATAKRSRDRVEWAMLALLAVLLAGSAAVMLLGRGSHPAARTVGLLGHKPGKASGALSTSTPAAGKALVQAQHVAYPGLVVRATTGPCWVDVREWSETGPLLVMKTLQPGHVLRLRRPRIWLRLGDPAAATVTFNGKRIPIPKTANPTNFTISKQTTVA